MSKFHFGLSINNNRYQILVIKQAFLPYFDISNMAESGLGRPILGLQGGLRTQILCPISVQVMMY